MSKSFKKEDVSRIQKATAKKNGSKIPKGSFAAKTQSIFDKQQVKNVIKYLKANIDQNLKLEDMARHFNLSASHFSKKFKQRTRYSPINYFLHLKVQHSCKLLNLTTMRISEIARAVGIEDQFYFSRLFKKVMNQSPKDYRQGG